MDQMTVNTIQALAFAASQIAGTEAQAAILKKIEALLDGTPQELTTIERVAYDTSVANAAEFKRQLERLGALDQIGEGRGMSGPELHEFTELLHKWHPVDAEFDEVE